PRPTYWSNVVANVWALRFHAGAFLIAGTHGWYCDERIAPNDFRNMFLFAVLVYVVAFPLVTAIGRARWPLWRRVVVAPVAIYAWLWLGADGNTAKAGQTRQAGEDPQGAPRSARHRVMLAWHRLCDDVLGDLRSPYEKQ